MLKKLSTILLLIFGILIIAQRYDSIRFENIQKNNFAKDLFIKKIISKDEIIYENEDRKYNSVETFEKFKSTKYASWVDMKKIDQDENIKKIGKIYGIDMYSETENVFTYEVLNFCRFILFSNIEDEIVAVKLENDYENLSQLNQFISNYSKKYKNKIYETGVGIKEYYFYLDDRTIKLNVGENQNSMTTGPMVVPSTGETKSEEKTKIEFFVIYNNLNKDVENFLYENLNFR